MIDCEDGVECLKLARASGSRTGYIDPGKCIKNKRRVYYGQQGGVLYIPVSPAVKINYTKKENAARKILQCLETGSRIKARMYCAQWT